MRVSLHVSAASFSWTPSADGSAAAPPEDKLLAAWHACWSCVRPPHEGSLRPLHDGPTERTALGPAAARGGRLDLADVLGGEARAGPAGGAPALLVTFLDRRRERSAGNDAAWALCTLRFAAPAAAAAARVADALRLALRGPAFKSRPRRLLVRRGAAPCACSWPQLPLTVAHLP